MCLTIPGKISRIKKGVAILEDGATVDVGLIVGAKAGDWILYATDRAVKIIDEKEAYEIIELLETKYQKVDNDKLPEKLKKIIIGARADNGVIASEAKQSLKSKTIKKITAPPDESGRLAMTKKDIEYLLKLEGNDELTTLYSEANTLRKEVLKDFVCIHGIIEFSNYCKNNCLYCGIRRDNDKIKRYQMSTNEIVEAAGEAIEDEGYKLIVLQSGEDFSYSDQEMIKLIKRIKKRHKVFIFLSVGERSEEFYKQAFGAGASGSLFRFETSNPTLYSRMHPGQTLSKRLKSLKMQIKIGYYVASGSLVGLPGQTVSDIANDILMIKKLGVPMISSGPFIPTVNTPLANSKFEILNPKPFDFAQGWQKSNSKLQISNGVIARSRNDEAISINKDRHSADRRIAMTTDESVELFLKYIAVSRLLIPEIKIPVTTALETLDPKNGRHRGLLAGANALMFNLTPAKYCKKYRIYDNKYIEREKVWQKYGLFKGEESYEMLEERLKTNFQ